MHLMYTLDAEGTRVYTLKKINGGEVTKSAHPARFSPDDKYSRHRVTLKKRYGLLLTQQSEFSPQVSECSPWMGLMRWQRILRFWDSRLGWGISEEEERESWMEDVGLSVKALKAFGGGVKSLGCPEPKDATI